ncbi:MAG: hypothetical protein QOE36_1107 [Gaiellaceae bacterium]|jgi:putative nucleotidyltransferase with HDIG domain|nr:hypothetical protein [Gaiellaceae bacterium]
MRVFLLASAVILGGGAFVLASVLGTSLRHQATDDEQRSLNRYVDGVLRERLVRDGRLVVVPSLSRELEASIKREPDLLTVKVWRADGVLAWTNRGRDRIGRRFSLNAELAEVIDEKRTVGGIHHPSKGENLVESKLGLDHLLEVYAPIESNDGRALGAYEIYANPSRLESFVASRQHLIWLVIGAVFLALYAALALLVRGTSNFLRSQTETLRQRSKALMESYRQLEESSLEAIEALNATVEAKDPYTAGHSIRVQAISLAIGRQLGLDPARLGVLRHAALFHDLGKLAVRDAVLLKPGRLTAEEYEQIKRHSADGAEIVARLGRLREAVPLIRHHHERWDGTGYPDALVGEETPLEAAVIGLADAWDAMTTDRPYQAALSLDAATDQVRGGRGTQFAPAVVDAFFVAFRRQPSVFTPPGQSTALRAAAS